MSEVLHHECGLLDLGSNSPPRLARLNFVTREPYAERTQAGYDALAPVWAETTDDSLWNEVLDRRPIRSLLPSHLNGVTVLEGNP